MPTITLTAGTLPQPACYEDEQLRLNAFVAAITASVTGGIQWEAGQSAPDDLTKYWLRTDANGRPLEALNWSAADAAWVRWFSTPTTTGASSGSGNGYTLTNSPVYLTTVTAYSSGRVYMFVANHANTGASTLNVDGLGARNIFRDVNQPLVAGTIRNGQVVVVMSDGSNFQLISPKPAVVDSQQVYTYISDPTQMPESNGVLTFNHGLGLNLAHVRVVLVRKNTDFTHTASGRVIPIGQQVDAASVWTFYRGTDNERFGPVVRVDDDDEDVHVQFYYPWGFAWMWGWVTKNGGSADVANGTLGVAADWDVIVYAEAFNPTQTGTPASGGSESGGESAPQITVQPVNTSVADPASVAFTVQAVDAETAIWEFDGTEVASAGRFTIVTTVSGSLLASTFTIDPTEATDDAKTVSVIVLGDGGQLTSSVVTLTVT